MAGSLAAGSQSLEQQLRAISSPIGGRRTARHKWPGVDFRNVKVHLFDILSLQRSQLLILVLLLKECHSLMTKNIRAYVGYSYSNHHRGYQGQSMNIRAHRAFLKEVSVILSLRKVQRGKHSCRSSRTVCKEKTEFQHWM